MADVDTEDGDLTEREPEQIRAEARKLWLRLGVAVLVIVGATVGLGLASGGRVVDPGKGTYDPGTSDPVKAAIPGLRSFVEATRGLSFTAAVPVKVVDPAVLRRRARELVLTPRQRPFADHAATEHALGLPPSTTGAALAGTSPAPQRAFYDYTDHTIYLAAGRFTPYHRALLVHLLTVAVDDQHFGLADLVRAAATDLDRLRSLDALIEGDATRVELAYVGLQRPGVQAQIRAIHDYTPRANTYRQNDALFATSAGTDFVSRIGQRSGNGGVDDAFGHPPAATSLILDPDAFIEHRAAVTVRPPEHAGPTIDGGSLGQFGLAMLVTGGRSYANAAEADSWQGDSYVTYRSGGRTCVADTMLVRGGVARDQLIAQLRRRLPGIAISRSPVDDGFTFTSCR